MAADSEAAYASQEGAIGEALEEARDHTRVAIAALERIQRIEGDKPITAAALQRLREGLMWVKSYGHDGRWKE